MRRYSVDLKQRIQSLRRQGMTYGEINAAIGFKIAKSSLHSINKQVFVSSEHWEKVRLLNLKNLEKARDYARRSNMEKRLRIIENFKEINRPIALKAKDINISKIVLSILCLGEASKSKSRSAFCLGNTDPRIIKMFLRLLEVCFEDFDPNKIRCTIQCRADQNIASLERYWQEITKVPKSQFYKTRIDPRSIGKPTLKQNYRGVLKVDYLDSKTQLDLESLADLIYNCVVGGP